ncbi:hypothetical protein BU17DRAFT_103347 [Hysterangium stoloniferum]|nr:hypothetical protein BU17DRAFT_103347 [Hysterangium stoloniferum]
MTSEKNFLDRLEHKEDEHAAYIQTDGMVQASRRDVHVADFDEMIGRRRSYPIRAGAMIHVMLRAFGRRYANCFLGPPDEHAVKPASAGLRPRITMRLPLNPLLDNPDSLETHRIFLLAAIRTPLCTILPRSVHGTSSIPYLITFDIPSLTGLGEFRGYASTTSASVSVSLPEIVRGFMFGAKGWSVASSTIEVPTPHRDTNSTPNFDPNLNPTSSDNNDNISVTRHLDKSPKPSHLQSQSHTQSQSQPQSRPALIVLLSTPAQIAAEGHKLLLGNTPGATAESRRET